MDDQSFAPAIRHDWTRADILALYDLPFNDLIFRAAALHRQFHDPNKVQLSQLLSIKTGGCPEDCAYCPQAARYHTGVKAEPLMPLDAILADARAAKTEGATRYCMGAAWRSPKDRDLDKLVAIVEGVHALGLETCMTLGMLEPHQAQRLAEAGLDYYNHNLDTAPEAYGDIISTRTYEDRLNTLAAVRDAGMAVCCGGIVGMGEDRSVRAGLIEALATQDPHPESVPINLLVQVEGTPLAGTEALDSFEFIRTIAVARLTMPQAAVRLSAGRETLTDEAQALAFFAGANSIFYGERLLTTPNPQNAKDRALFDRLDIAPL